MTATASKSKAPRYAPADPTLPKPWRALIDGNSGYLYFWNPETNVTQYERPVADPPPPKPAPPHRGEVAGCNAPSRGSGTHQRPDDRGSTIQREGPAKVGQEVFAHGYNAQNPVGSARGCGSSNTGGGSGSSAEAYRRQHEITVIGADVPDPYATFASTGFPSEILREAQNAGFSAPTPIQAQSWPIALQSRDIVAIAKTGSGKTLGYLIPGFIHLKRILNNSKMGPTVLVLSPTRELATQIQDEAEKFGRSSRISCVCLYGGAPKGPQLRDLDRGADVVVATPGRLNDILEMKRVSLHQVSYLVLDEADRMLDMGFEPQIRKIVKEIPPRRQTLMFTATWPKEVRKIAADLLVNPVQVNIGNVDELIANKSITQYVEVIGHMEKNRRLEQILRSQEPGSKVIVFCATKRMCDQLARTLAHQFGGAAAIHGDKSQSERDSVLSQFRSGRSPVLVATDVAARGLDIKDIRVVINYDFPTGVEDYVHRIGRTGRAGATGVAYTFFCDKDSKYAAELVKILEGASQRVPPELRDVVSRGGYGGKSRRWGSGSDSCHGGYSYGGRGSGRDDSSYGGRGGWGLPPSSGRADGGCDVHGRGDQESFHARYYSNYQDGRNDTRSTMRASDDRTGVRIRSRSRSRSLSPRNNWGHGEQGESRSSSRSDSGSGGGNRSEWAAPVQRQSPDPRGPSPAGDHGHSQMQQRSPVRSAQPYEREEGLIPTGEDGLIPPEEGAGFPVQEPTLVN